MVDYDRLQAELTAAVNGNDLVSARRCAAALQKCHWILPKAAVKAAEAGFHAIAGVLVDALGQSADALTAAVQCGDAERAQKLIRYADSVQLAFQAVSSTRPDDDGEAVRLFLAARGKCSDKVPMHSVNSPGVLRAVLASGKAKVGTYDLDNQAKKGPAFKLVVDQYRARQAAGHEPLRQELARARKELGELRGAARAKEVEVARLAACLPPDAVACVVAPP